MTYFDETIQRVHPLALSFPPAFARVSHNMMQLELKVPLLRYIPVSSFGSSVSSGSGVQKRLPRVRLLTLAPSRSFESQMLACAFPSRLQTRRGETPHQACATALQPDVTGPGRGSAHPLR